MIRVNTEDKNSALTVQDVGHVMPGGEIQGRRHTRGMKSRYVWVLAMGKKKTDSVLTEMQ